MHTSALERDPLFYRHLACWYFDKGEVRDHKLLFVAHMATSDYPEFREKESALVIDAFDNREARAAVSEAVRTLQIPCLHIGFSGDGLYGNGLWEPGYQVPQEVPGDPCDYPLTRPLVLALAALAARAISDFLRTGQGANFELTWNDSKITWF